MSGAQSSLFLSVVVPAFDEASRWLATIEGTSKYLAGPALAVTSHYIM